MPTLHNYTTTPLKTPLHHLITIPVKAPAASLCWRGDTLVDWVGGGRVFHLDRSITESHRYFAYPFDAAVQSPSGECAVIYQRRGTKGLVLDSDKLQREINRSYYHAHVYEYPVAIARLQSGREVLIHCPDGYNQIDVEDLRTGERLTPPGERKCQDFFHSRFRIDPSGRYLLSAGWVWHPVQLARAYDIERGLADPDYFDHGGVDVPQDQTGEIGSACFRDSDILVATTSDDWGEENKDVPDALSNDALGIVTFDGRLTRVIKPVKDAGEMMPVGDSHVVSFFDHPRLIELGTGSVVHAWPQINCGKQFGCIVMRDDVLAPPIACDAARRRFAVAGKDAIHVVMVGEGEE